MSALTRHWELKVLALAFAAALWLFVVTSEKSDLIVSVPVELDGIPPDLVIEGEQPDSVDVQLHGQRAALARLAPERLRARLDLKGARAGEVVVRVLPEHIAVPSGVTVLRVNPSRVRLVLAGRAARSGDARREGPRS